MGKGVETNGASRRGGKQWLVLVMHHPRMLHARTRVSMATGATLVALLALAAIARPALADEGLPTPLPDSVSGPPVQTVLDTATTLGLECVTFTGTNGDQYSCARNTGDVYYIASFYTSDPAYVIQLYVSGPLPWPDDHDPFLVGLAGLFCPAENLTDVQDVILFAREGGMGSWGGPTCLVESTYTTEGIPVQMLTAFAQMDPAQLATAVPTVIPTAPPPLATPTASPTAGPSPTPMLEPTPPGDGGDGGSVIRPTDFVRSVPPPNMVSTEPLILAQSLALAGLLVLLMPFPAQLFNSTLETHYGTVRRWFRLDALQRATGRMSGFWESFVGILAFVFLAAVIYALLDPTVGLDASGAATIAGLAIGIVLTTIMASGPLLMNAIRTGTAWRIRALPATLFVGLVCVLISRLTGFLPGYLYGVILGFVFARELSRSEQGRANGLAAAALLGMALLAWLGLALIGPDPSGVVATIAATTFSTLLVAGLEAVVFGLLPFRFLPGEPLHATNRLFWAALLFVGAFCFFHILINPASGYLSSSATTPLFATVALLVAFGLLSIAFWAYFRNRPVEA